MGPGDLQQILSGLPRHHDPKLTVGFDTADDAAVYQLNDTTALIQTLDFFPPNIKDPYLFGQIAAANALSDVYAMGGEVLTALNIISYPRGECFDSLEAILQGGADKVKEAGAVLAGGHSIHSDSILYGLSVLGQAHPERILQNDNAKAGDVLILTKKLGSGLVTSAYKKDGVTQTEFDEAVEQMVSLNKYAAQVMKNYTVHSCTDVTGFGLLGHLDEMLKESVSATIYSGYIYYLKGAYESAQKGFSSGGGKRNRQHLKDRVLFQEVDEAVQEILFDPQTSGGLLMSVPEDQADSLLKDLQNQQVPASIIGRIETQTSQKPAIIVK
ncbi:selenide, water dikinase SelD [Dolosicoccus paucivorans]|uniref:selenide, water dikinase SelD n=1 Tax=Dolosicoccus paucivorans TaxID=84521 RepID=UPI002155789B|nr:selenide, water dikinase SelD [Dolosicoccus paucivorans]